MGRQRDNAATDEPGRRDRISLPLAPDGSGFVWEKMRASTKRALFDAVMADPRRIYDEVGEPVPGDTGDDPGGGELDPFGGITLENVRTGLDILSQVNALAVRVVGPRFIKHPFKKDPTTGKPLPLVIDPDILQTAFTLTEAQHKELDPRALKEAQKLSGKMPEWVKQHMNLCILACMYIKYTGENALTAMQTQVKRDAALAQQAQQRAARPMPGDSDAGRRPVRITEEPQPGTETVDTYPPPAPANGGMAADL